MSRSVIVTGGFGTLGTAVAQAFIQLGDAVSRVDFAPQAQQAVAGASDHGGIDLTDAAGTQAAFAKIAEAQGGIDVLVNVAGGFVWEMVSGGSLDNWTRMYRMNALTAATASQTVLPWLEKSSGGRVINIGAGAAIKADTGMGAYAASKAGVHRLTEALAQELMGSGTTVNAILPSIIDTPVNRADMPDADFSQWITPGAIADVVCFLASPAARSVSGALIPVTAPAAS